MISTINSNTNRISGLASGMDTDTLVKNLTQTDRDKITKAQQQKQILEWTQDGYREVVTKLSDFNTKYFGTSNYSLSFAQSLQQLSATVSSAASPASAVAASQYVSVAPGTNAVSGNVYIGDIVSLATSAKMRSSACVTPPLTLTVDDGKVAGLSGRSVTVTLDGVAKVVTFTNKNYESADDVMVELQALLNKAFGENRISIANTNGKISFSAGSSTIFLSNSGSTDGEALPLLGYTGDTSLSNRIKINSSLAQSPFSLAATDPVTFSINGKEFSFTGANTITNIMNTINASTAGVTMSYSSVTDTFTLISKETGTGAAIDLKDETGSFLEKAFGTGTFTAGTNAEIKVGINGATDDSNLITLTRSSNTFDIDGTSYTLLGKAEGDTKEAINVAIGLNTDDVVSKLKAFVSDYNEMVKLLNDKVNEPVYRDFAPLTDDQKESLSDEDEKLWTEKAKSGMLRSDMYLTQISQALRATLYAPIKKLDNTGGNLATALADIGITTASYSTTGELSLDESKLRKALSERPEETITLLTQNSTVGYSMYNTKENKEKRYNESGILWRLNDIVKNNISKVGIKGPLVEMVGSPDNNFMGITTYGKKLTDMDNTISDLQEKLSEEEDRYWTKFSAMESSLSQLNSQSSWLTSQLNS